LHVHFAILPIFVIKKAAHFIHLPDAFGLQAKLVVSLSTSANSKNS